MECYLDPNIDFNNISTVLKNQRTDLLYHLFNATQFNNQPYSVHNTHPLKFEEIDGLTHAGFTKQAFLHHIRQERKRPFREKARTVLENLRKKDAIWPFVNRVSEEVAPDYYQIIKEPMWLEKVSENLESGEYQDKMEQFGEDLMKIFDNAITYNRADTVYHKYAVQLK